MEKCETCGAWKRSQRNDMWGKCSKKRIEVGDFEHLGYVGTFNRPDVDEMFAVFTRAEDGCPLHEKAPPEPVEFEAVVEYKEPGHNLLFQDFHFIRLPNDTQIGQRVRVRMEPL